MAFALWIGALIGAACGGSSERVRAAEEPRDPLAAEALMRDASRLASEEFEGRGSYDAGGRRAARWVAAEMERAGLEMNRQPIGGGAENVIGRLPGEAETAVLVSAHYDHLGRGEDGAIYPGADDNASGVAVLLGLARAAGAGSIPRERTLLFAALGAEEPGLFGARAYVADPPVPLADTAVLINFDMVGRSFFEAGSGRDAAAAVVGPEDAPALERAARRAAGAAGLDLIGVPAAVSEAFGYAWRTDDWPFRRRGVPAFHFSTALHDDYHRPTDTADKLAPEQMERIARMACGLVTYAALERPRDDVRIRSSSGAAPGCGRQ